MLSTSNSDPYNPEFPEPTMNLTRNKRDEFLIEIRKKKNSNILLQKRIKLTSYSDHKPSEQRMLEESPLSLDFQIDPQLLERLQIERDNFYTHLRNEAYDDLTTTVIFLRICTIDRPDPENIENPDAIAIGIPGRYIVELGIVPELIGLLSERFYQYKDLQVECAWLLTNLSADSGPVIGYLAENKIIPALAECFRYSSNQGLHENAIWALANISGEKNLGYRDEILEQDVLNMVVRELYKGAKTLKYYEISAWLISNLLRGKPYPAYNKIAKVFGALSYLVDYEEFAIKCFALQSLIYLTEEPEEEHLKSLISNDLMPKIFKCLASEEKSEEDGRCHVAIGAVKIIANLTNIEGFFQKELYKMILRNVSEIMKREDEILREEICKLLINMLGVYSDNYSYVMDYGIMVDLVELIATGQEGVRIQGTTCLESFLFNCPTPHAMILVEKGLVSVLLENLQSMNSMLVENSLRALSKVLTHGEGLHEGNNGENPLVLSIKQNGMQGVLERLQEHDEMKIRSSACVLWDKFFDIDYYC